MPSRVADQSRVPMPSENSSTLTRKSFASAKWPRLVGADQEEEHADDGERADQPAHDLGHVETLPANRLK